MTDPIKKLADIYEALENGQKAVVRDVKVSILQMQDHIRDLESTLERQPLPEAPVSMTAKVVHAATQIEWLVTVREVRAARLLISAMPLINEVLAEQGLIAFDVYVDSCRAERAEGGKALPAPGKSSIPPPPASQATGEVKTGTGTLMQLTIDTSGKAEFKIDTLQYPLKDSRGAAAVASLFDPSLGWEPGHFAEPALYSQKDFGQLKLDWKKGGRYYDVVRIYR